ncbi:MAG: dienelactone hydrolase family protein [Novosphingobium sp.]|nr:dienelactone hydrolase family protein [Novosphingobium sp.]
MNTFSAEFPRGSCPMHAFGPDDPSLPLVLFFPDAFGPRPASFAVAEEIAAEGCRVWMLDQFYEHIPYDPIEPNSIFEDGPKRDRVMQMFATVTMAKIDEDVAAMLSLAERKSGPETPFAAIGYCMGGRYVLSAACASQRVRFAGAFHAASLAPVEGDSPHTRFASAKARIYIGVSGIDPMYDAAEHGRLAEALRAADTDHMIETYHGVAHGFVFPDLGQIYDEAAAKKHMRRIKENLAEVL